MNHLSRANRNAGGLWGSIVGDALGVPVEFQSRADVRRNPVIGMRGYGTHRQAPGTWSDDSSMMLCTLESLVLSAGLDLVDLAARFVKWERFGDWTPHGDVFDIGVTTSQALSRVAAGTKLELAGGSDVYSNGNGSLMRILPVTLRFSDAPTDELLDSVHRASSITHRHPRSQMCCGFHALFVRELLAGSDPQQAYGSTISEFRKAYAADPWVTERLNFQRLESGKLGEMPESEIGSGGYVMETLTASIWCLLTSETFEEAVLKAVNLGSDTDTTGCVTGGLAGVYFGLGAIPDSWLSALASREKVAALITSALSQPWAQTQPTYDSHAD